MQKEPGFLLDSRKYEAYTTEQNVLLHFSACHLRTLPVAKIK